MVSWAAAGREKPEPAASAAAPAVARCCRRVIPCHRFIGFPPNASSSFRLVGPGGLSREMAQQLSLIVQEFDAQRVAWPGQGNLHLGFQRAGMWGHDHDPV